jgi:hypothetical protein
VCWLFLISVVDHLLKNWKPIHSYFLSQGEEYIDPLIWTFITGQANHNDDEFNTSYVFHLFLAQLHELCNKNITKNWKIMEHIQQMCTTPYKTHVLILSQDYRMAFMGSK